jgi:hypothetical protein
MSLSPSTIALILASDDQDVETQAELAEALVDLVGEDAPRYFERACQIAKEVRDIVCVG